MSEQRIPKILHYCWFGNGELPEKEKKCIASWKKILPDYEMKLWNEKSFNIDFTEWTRTAYEAKKYAFVSDYVRLWALKHYGGVYLDTDVKMIKSFDDLLGQEMFLCFEDIAGQVVASCVIGAVPEHTLINKMLEYYNKPFDLGIIESNEANTIVMTRLLVEQGLKLDGTYQTVNGIEVYPRTYFCPMDFWGNWNMARSTYCIHWFSGSWLPEDAHRRHNRRNGILFRTFKRIYGKLKIISFVRKLREKTTRI